MLDYSYCSGCPDLSIVEEDVSIANGLVKASKYRCSIYDKELLLEPSFITNCASIVPCVECVEDVKSFVQHMQGNMEFIFNIEDLFENRKDEN